MQKLGQHFLRNQYVVAKIIEALEINNGDTIIEVGPGHGELTMLLAQQCGEKEARLIAIERDEKLVDGLENNFKDLQNISVIAGDIIEVLPALIRNPRLKKAGLVHGAAQSAISNYKIVGNLPYYLTGHLLRIVGELEPGPELCVFMVQKEVAQRIVAGPPEMNRLAASVQFWSDTKIIAKVPRKDFIPPPKVDSAVVSIKKKKENLHVGAGQYYTAVRALFAQPRKTIFNNLRDKRKETRDEAGKGVEDLAQKLLEVGVNPKARPQNLSIEDIIVIASSLF
jgi:16S rRNA (adenine1518-N6/adenine1519-N6)-dimethyltransferase